MWVGHFAAWLCETQEALLLRARRQTAACITFPSRRLCMPVHCLIPGHHPCVVIDSCCALLPAVFSRSGRLAAQRVASARAGGRPPPPPPPQLQWLYLRLWPMNSLSATFGIVVVEIYLAVPFIREGRAASRCVLDGAHGPASGHAPLAPDAYAVL